jgi:translation initiation factor 5
VEPGDIVKKEKKGKDREKRKDGSRKKDQDSDEQPDNDNDDDSEDWCDDTDADAVAKRQNMLTAGVNRLMANDDLEKSAEDRLQLFYEYFTNMYEQSKEKKEKSDVMFSVDEQKQIVNKAESLDIRDKCSLVLCELLFNEDMIQQISAHRMLLLRFTTDNKKAQKNLLKGFELTVKEYSTELLPKCGFILQAFYDKDIIDEQVILEWGEKVYKKTVGKELAEKIHQKAAPFLKWLREAEEDDSEEDEEDLNVVYDDRVRADKIQVQKEDSPPKAAAPIKGSNDEELDIDAI